MMVAPYLHLHLRPYLGAGRRMALLGIALLLPQAAHADSGTVSVPVTASIGMACDISGSISAMYPGGLLDFGRQIMLPFKRKAIEAVAGAMIVKCNIPGTTLSISIDGGDHPDASSLRHLAGPDGFLVPYYLTRDSAATIVWDATPQALVVPTSDPTPIPIYGQIRPFTGWAPDGDYTDNVRVTIEY